jgi:DNA-binding NarL/FixJ family response regulator
MKLLIADDSILIIQSLKKLLLSLNNSLQIIEARNIQQTLELSHELHPDLIILDIRMQDGNGIDALKVIKQKDPNQKVMMFTNYPNPLNREKCASAGADYFFDKSDDFEKVVLKVKELNQPTPDKTNTNVSK